MADTHNIIHYKNIWRNVKHNRLLSVAVDEFKFDVDCNRIQCCLYKIVLNVLALVQGNYYSNVRNLGVQGVILTRRFCLLFPFQHTAMAAVKNLKKIIKIKWRILQYETYKGLYFCSQGLENEV